MSNNFPGGLIRKTPVTPAGPFQSGAAPGMWTLAEASFWTKQGLWPIAGNIQPVVEDVFSTWLYTGNGSTQTITNGINLSGQGGMVWLKTRSVVDSSQVYDTVRGATKNLSTANTNAQADYTTALTSFTSSGFTLGAGFSANTNNVTYASWTFREAPNFFDVVTYTGTGANRTIAHNLGVAPGMILVKRTDASADWQVYHRSNANTQYMVLNSTAAVATGATRWNSTTPTATEFSVGTDATVNASGGTYVAYLFAHVTASDGFIQCGSFTTDGSGNATVTLGWEPQWLTLKSSSNTQNWFTLDQMRGFGVGNTTSWPFLSPNLSAAEDTNSGWGSTATGFTMSGFLPSATYIYVAIRRGPMRTPTLGTSVFSPVPVNLSGNPAIQIVTGFPIDMFIYKQITSTQSNFVFDRLRGGNLRLFTNTTDSETSGLITSYYNFGFDYNDRVVNKNPGLTDPSYIAWLFRRAPGFFDEVCYTPAAVTGTAVKHNLGVVPELVISKSRTAGTGPWLVAPIVYGNGQRMRLNTADASAIQFNTGYPATSTEIYENAQVGNFPAAPWVAYLFASAPGVSKVGTYTGNGSSQTINCAFTTGARFVLIKRTDSTGEWYVWDSARGIVAGNDPYLALNTTAAEVTSNDSVDTDNTGFIVNQVAASNINVNAATYIFLAIA